MAQETEVVLRDNGINHLDVKSEKLVLASDNLDQFVRLARARDIRKGVVSKLKRLLLKGKHFDTPLVCNRKNGKNRLIDGNHRKIAIEEFLEMYPNRKVEIWMMYYENLSEEEEREKYTQWNSGTKQNTNDYVKLYWDDISIAGMFDKGYANKNFPCKVSHSWGKDTIEFKSLLSTYMTRNVTPFNGAFRGSAPDFVDEVSELAENDYKVIKAFMVDFIEVFGTPDRENPHYKQANFYALMRIWLDNRTRVTIADLRKAFVRVRSCSVVILNARNSGSMEITTRNREDLLRLMNGHRTKNPLV